MPDPDAQLLIAIETFGGGGAERVALDLARAWPRDHARPVLLVASRTGAYADRLPPGLEVIEIGIPSSPRRLLPFLWRLRQRLAGRRIAGVVSHMTGMNRMMLRAALLGILRSPVVVVEHNDFLRNQNVAAMTRLRSSLLLRETAFLYRRAAAVVGCSQGVARQAAALFGLARDRVQAIPNPVEPRFAAPAPMETGIADWFAPLARPVFISAGRMVPQKGFDDLIRAFARQPCGSLVILGEGPLRPDLAALAEELGVAARVRMPGFLPVPEQVLQAADVYVSASLWEGYPLVLIEAYAAGLPVVARACDFGPDEIVIPSRPGRLVRSGRVEDLAAAMAEVAATTPRAAPGSIPLPENAAPHVVRRYRALFSGGLS
ncbi:glycosyltransferase [Cereibacter sphaeroides]|uniref:glycosyltransferase n=1 Tax=Cereibacter sphaeroides TaxID=1063 RepID=UPI001F1B3439|nr:glycosyltransferase [Cereibacter sphaeroides]MCE6967484.1 glycosyltransferase [Cereibacter sphaeroides]